MDGAAFSHPFFEKSGFLRAFLSTLEGKTMKTFKLTPSCKDYLWGGEKLREEYGIQSDLHP